MAAVDGDQIEQKYLYTAVAAFAGVGFLIVLLMYKKYSANWGGINVFIVAGILAPIVMYLFSRLRWFQSGYSTPRPVIALVVCGLILNVAIGVYNTEQPLYEVSRSDYVYAYQQNNTRGIIYTSSEFLPADLDFDFDLDSDGGIGLAILFLIVIIIILFIGSLLLPHFWVVSGVILVAFLILLAMREYAAVEPPEKYQDLSEERKREIREQTFNEHVARMRANKNFGVINGSDGMSSGKTKENFLDYFSEPEIIPPEWYLTPSDKEKLKRR